MRTLRQNRGYMREYMRGRRKQEGTLPWDRNYYKKLKRRVVEMLGGPRCNKCGCTVEKILEINHVNGGGQRELKNGSSIRIYRRIARGDFRPGEFNLLCRVCNALHYVKKLLGIKGHTVIWKDC